MWSYARKQFGAVWKLTIPYFSSKDRHVLSFGPLRGWTIAERWIGGALLLAVIAIELGQVWLAVLLNNWNAQFYDALQTKNLTAFWHQLSIFSIIAAAFIIASVYQLYLNQWLQIRWRRWLTDRYLARWLDGGTHYRMRLKGDAADNPDQRIAEDLAMFISRTLTLSIGALSALTTLASFSVILWGISARVPLSIAGHSIEAGYLVWIAAAFSFVASVGAHLIGRLLVGLDFNRQRYEAELRFALVHLRENSEQVALLGGEPVEFNLLHGRFSNIVSNWYAIMRRQKALTFFTAGYDQIAVVLPFLIIAPHYFAGAILLGTLTQTAGAFGQVQSAFSFLVNSYPDLAEWMAVVDRLSGFEAQIDVAKTTAAQTGATVHNGGATGVLNLHDVSVTTPAGAPLMTCINLDLKAGEAILLTGPSGSGKTTLLRTICGFWPYSTGDIWLRRAARRLAVPQKPYLPLGSLRAALAYPASVHDQPEDEILKVLRGVGLGHLQFSLDFVARWSDILSVGEQQRVAIARAILARPDVLFLDEATSALDEPAEARLLRRLRAELPDAGIVSIGHRTSLAALHDRSIDLTALDREWPGTASVASR
jgi:putative ATP-binding cassette transporter